VLKQLFIIWVGGPGSKKPETCDAEFLLMATYY